jgi:predicted CXXCH cytochrome family protein
MFVVFAMLPIGVRQLSTGPLSSVHVSFEDDCQKCHFEGMASAISADAWRINPQATLSRLENACQECHLVASHFRAFLKDPRPDQDCASCHREHRGTRNDLTWVENTACRQCHRSLDQVMTAAPRIKPDIDEFTRDSHGDFRSLQKDPGEVRFDHAQHLSPGQVRPGSKGGTQLAWLAASWRAIYRKEGQSDDALVQLTCGDCHQSHSLSSSSLVSAADTEVGRHHEPVRFDDHCAGCHELNYRGRTNEQLPLPHAAPWSEIQSLLAAKIRSGQLVGRILPLYERPDLEPMPGKRQRGSSADESNLTDESLAFAVASVRDKCLLCHKPGHLTDPFIAESQTRRGSTLIPRRWLQWGLFDHAAHARIQCEFCHQIPLAIETASASGVTEEARPNARDQRVMIRGIESCVGCHRDEASAPPEDLVSAEAKGLFNGEPTWAPDRCVLCHRYHWTRPGAPVATSD